MRMKLIQEDMDEIDWEAMQDGVDLEAVEAMAMESEVWLLTAKVRRLQEELEESEDERERRARRLNEEVEARASEEERADRYKKNCEFFMKFAKNVTAEMHGKPASFLKVGIARKKRKKLTQGLTQERETQMRRNPNQRKLNQEMEPMKDQKAIC